MENAKRKRKSPSEESASSILISKTHRRLENCDRVSTSSCCLSDQLASKKYVDLEVVDCEPVDGELESTAKPHELINFRLQMPSEAAELQEFFEAAEKSIQKAFIDKYNFDIVKDEPLEGRYEWVGFQVKP